MRSKLSATISRIPADFSASGLDSRDEPLPVALAGDDHLEATVADRITADRMLVAGLEADVRDVAQPIVVVQHDRGRRDLVGRYVVAKRQALPEHEVGAGNLRANDVRSRRQKQDAAADANAAVRHGRSR
jgi:hypothetical protein